MSPKDGFAIIIDNTKQYLQCFNLSSIRDATNFIRIGQIITLKFGYEYTVDSMYAEKRWIENLSSSSGDLITAHRFPLEYGAHCNCRGSGSIPGGDEKIIYSTLDVEQVLFPVIEFEHLDHFISSMFH